MSQVSGNQPVADAVVFDGAVDVVEGSPERGGGRGVGGDELGQAGAEEAGIGAGEEECGAESLGVRR